jgi:hypothetical protein
LYRVTPDSPGGPKEGVFQVGGRARTIATDLKKWCPDSEQNWTLEHGQGSGRVLG